jgi:hypothetical protein
MDITKSKAERDSGGDIALEKSLSQAGFTK